MATEEKENEPEPWLVQPLLSSSHYDTYMDASQPQGSPKLMNEKSLATASTTKEPIAGQGLLKPPYFASTTHKFLAAASTVEKTEFHLCCEWGECSYETVGIEGLLLHVQDHLMLLLEEHKQENGFLEEIESFVCVWRQCGHNNVWQFVDLVRHMYFHVFHNMLKKLGAGILQREGLPPCQNDVGSVAMVPELTASLQCCWDDCEATFDNPYWFYHHVNMHCEFYPDDYPKQKVACKWQGCSHTVKTKYRLKEHFRLHTQEKVAACPTCGNLFSSKMRLVDHIERQQPCEDIKYQCDHCRKVFASTRLLRDHVKVHVNHFKCPSCEMTCWCPSSLRTHILHRHSDSIPHRCSLCSKVFKVLSDLKRHEDTHRGGRFPCSQPGCTFSTANYTWLQRHVKSAHEGLLNSRFMCHMCGARYARGQKLTVHLKKKHKLSWPSGHKRFRYVEGEDGFCRLQTIRYESIDLTEQILTDKMDATTTQSDAHQRKENLPEISVKQDDDDDDDGNENPRKRRRRAETTVRSEIMYEDDTAMRDISAALDKIGNNEPVDLRMPSVVVDEEATCDDIMPI